MDHLALDSAPVNMDQMRVQREISGYAQLSQAAMKSTRMIADIVAQLGKPADGSATFAFEHFARAADLLSPVE